jgi:hypothetical protein
MTVTNIREINDDTVVRLAPEPVATAMPGETVILDARAGRYFSLAAVGARVWELLADGVTFEDLVRTVVAEYDVDRATCEGDMRALLSDLRAAELIVVDE